MPEILPGSHPPPAERSPEVHVWLADLTIPSPRLLQLQGSLSPEELGRANQFVSAADRDRYVAAHGCLRQLLARYAGCEPAHLRLGSGPFGKPKLIEPPSALSIQFNLSHSHQHALLALSRHHQIGIDLEWIRPDLDFQGVAERFFAPGEIRSLRALPDSQRTQAFYRCWTRKEAYTKARGLGLSLPLNQFEVSLLPGHPARLVADQVEMNQGEFCTLHDLAVPEGYVGALAVQGPDYQLLQFEMDLK